MLHFIHSFLYSWRHSNCGPKKTDRAETQAILPTEQIQTNYSAENTLVLRAQLNTDIRALECFQKILKILSLINPTRFAYLNDECLAKFVEYNKSDLTREKLISAIQDLETNLLLKYQSTIINLFINNYHCTKLLHLVNAILQETFDVKPILKAKVLELIKINGIIANLRSIPKIRNIIIVEEIALTTQNNIKTMLDKIISSFANSVNDKTLQTVVEISHFFPEIEESLRFLSWKTSLELFNKKSISGSLLQIKTAYETQKLFDQDRRNSYDIFCPGPKLALNLAIAPEIKTINSWQISLITAIINELDKIPPYSALAHSITLGLRYFKKTNAFVHVFAIYPLHEEISNELFKRYQHHPLVKKINRHVWDNSRTFSASLTGAYILYKETTFIGNKVFTPYVISTYIFTPFRLQIETLLIQAQRMLLHLSYHTIMQNLPALIFLLKLSIVSLIMYFNSSLSSRSFLETSFTMLVIEALQKLLSLLNRIIQQFESNLHGLTYGFVFLCHNTANIFSTILIYNSASFITDKIFAFVDNISHLIGLEYFHEQLLNDIELCEKNGQACYDAGFAKLQQFFNLPKGANCTVIRKVEFKYTKAHIKDPDFLDNRVIIGNAVNACCSFFKKPQNITDTTPVLRYIGKGSCIKI